MTNSKLSQCHEEKGNVTEFFKGKSVFITGGTGFVGKVLIEKLLRCCPDIGNIYMLVREKKKKDPYARIKEMTSLPLFDVVKQKCPENLIKLKPVKGDVRELGIGLCDTDRKLLEQEVSIIFHAAASVRFDDSLVFATILNVRGTREVVKLGMKMKKLKVLVHISTTYCNLHESVVEEKIYPPPADWQEMIRIAEERDELTLRILTPKILGTYPNTYTFTKGLAEHIINDHSDKIPCTIVRPSILISTARDPFPGWIDNFNGPIGLLVAAARGIVHVSYTRKSCVADFMPVDIAVTATIIATWKKGVERSSKEPSVYHCSSGRIHKLTMEEVVQFGQNQVWDYPIGYCIWYPSGLITDNSVIYFITAILFHVIPAVFIDLLLKIAGKKPILLKIARRIYIANTALSYFMLNDWRFKNDNVLDLEKDLRGPDIETFGYYVDDIVLEQYFANAVRGTRKYLLKKNTDSIENEKRQMRWMYCLALFTNTAAVCLFLWCIHRWFAAYQY